MFIYECTWLNLDNTVNGAKTLQQESKIVKKYDSLWSISTSYSHLGQKVHLQTSMIDNCISEGSLHYKSVLSSNKQASMPLGNIYKDESLHECHSQNIEFS